MNSYVRHPPNSRMSTVDASLFEFGRAILSSVKRHLTSDVQILPERMTVRKNPFPSVFIICQNAIAGLFQHSSLEVRLAYSVEISILDKTKLLHLRSWSYPFRVYWVFAALVGLFLLMALLRLGRALPMVYFVNLSGQSRLLN